MKCLIRYLISIPIGPGDFPDETIKVSFPQNVFNMSVPVPISDDMISELEETFFVVLIQAEAGPSGLVEDLIGTPNATEIIIQDDGTVFYCFHFNTMVDPHYMLPLEIGLP